jgi:hypothetical protein
MTSANVQRPYLSKIHKFLKITLNPLDWLGVEVRKFGETNERWI